MKLNFTTLSVFLLTIAVFVGYFIIQPTYTYALTDARLDAHQYIRLYQYFKNITANYQVRFPFNSRILSSLIASKLPFSTVETNFKVLNGVCIVLTMSLLASFWQKLNIKPLLIFCGSIFLLFHWKGPLRMYMPDPVNGDVLGFLISSAWLVTYFYDGIHSKARYFFLFVLAILGMMQKESFLIIVLVFGLNSMFRGTKTNFSFWVFLVFVSVGTYFLLGQFFPASNPDWRNNPVISLGRGIQRYLTEPSLFLKLPVSWFFTFGGFWMGVRIRFYELGMRNWKLGIRTGLASQLGINIWLASQLGINTWLASQLGIRKKDLRAVRRSDTIYELRKIYKQTNIETEKHSNTETKKQPNPQTTKQQNIETEKHLNPETIKHPNTETTKQKNTQTLKQITVIWLLLSVFAGGDTSRILMTAFPFVFTFLLIKLNNLQNWIFVFALVSSFPIMRLFDLEPDLGKFPNLSYNWCVECWSFSESWVYILYLLFILFIYFLNNRVKNF